MQILMTTFAFLILLATLAYGRMQQHLFAVYLSSLERLGYEKQVEELTIRADLLFKETAAQFKESPKAKTPKAEKKAKEISNKPLRLNGVNSRMKIDVGALSLTQKHQSAALYEIVARLIRNLYQKSDFFRSGMEYEIVDHLIWAMHPKQYIHLLPSSFKGPLTAEHHLTALPFSNEEARRAYYHLLQGTGAIPSLLQYITLQSLSPTPRKVSIHRASYEVLVAIFNNEEVVADIIRRRAELHQEGAYSYQGNLYTKLYLLQEEVEEILRRHHLKWSDYTTLVQLIVENK